MFFRNLLLCSKNRRDGTIKLIDFGCAKIQRDRLSDELPFSKGVESEDEVEETGTTGYWPPERFEKTRLTAAVDTWAVGVILYIVSEFYDRLTATSFMC